MLPMMDSLQPNDTISIDGLEVTSLGMSTAAVSDQNGNVWLSEESVLRQ